MIIDEAQQYPELFRVLRGVIDANRKVKGRFLLTGASSPEIVKGITESLAGRIATVEIKLNSVIKRQALRGLENFITDVKCPYGIVINRGKRVEFLTDKIVQIPVQFI